MRILSLFGVLVVGAGVGLACGEDAAPPAPSAGAGGKTGGSSGRGGGGSAGALGGEGGMAEGAMGGKAGSGAVGGDAGTSSGASGGESGAAGEGPAGAGGEAGQGTPFNGVYVGTNGSDQGKSTRDDPYATLAKAADSAVSGDTIVLLDGTYPTSGRVAIKDGVNLMAEHAGQAKLTGNSTARLETKGSSEVAGVTFEGFATAILAESADGTVSVTDASFINCANAGSSALEVGGQAKMALKTVTDNDWGTCPAFAHTYADGSLAMTGGTMHFTSAVGNIAFMADGRSTVTLDTVTATDGNRQLFALSGSAAATLTGATLSTLGNNVVTLNETASLVVDSSNISIDPAAPIAYACIQANGNATGTIVIQDSQIHGCSDAINGVPPADLQIIRTEIYDMTFNGLEFASGDGGTVTITDSHFHDTTSFGARFFASGGGANIVALTVRGTTFEGATENLRLQGADGSTWDLGTLSDPGGNTFGATTAALAVLTTDASFVSAVGNTWTPNQQGADASGHYTAVGAGAVLEVTSGSGVNYNVASGATLRLAENP